MATVKPNSQKHVCYILYLEQSLGFSDIWLFRLRLPLYLQEKTNFFDKPLLLSHVQMLTNLET